MRFYTQTHEHHRGIDLHALGATDRGRLLYITFTLCVSATLIRVISARDMHRKERVYDEQTKKDAT